MALAKVRLELESAKRPVKHQGFFFGDIRNPVSLLNLWAVLATRKWLTLPVQNGMSHSDAGVRARGPLRANPSNLIWIVPAEGVSNVNSKLVILH